MNFGADRNCKEHDKGCLYINVDMLEAKKKKRNMTDFLKRSFWSVILKRSNLGLMITFLVSCSHDTEIFEEHFYFMGTIRYLRLMISPILIMIFNDEYLWLNEIEKEYQRKYALFLYFMDIWMSIIVTV